jgi:hypothetical protein
MRRARLLSALVLPAVLALPAGATGSAPASARTASAAGERPELFAEPPAAA